MFLPEALLPHRAAFEAARRPAAYLLPKEGAFASWESHFFGHPYLPVGAEWPLGREGRPLLFLAQVNFAEMPELPGFPRKGLVQFFVSGHDNLFGLDFDQRLQSDARVVFWPEPVQDPSALQSDFSFLPDFPQTPGGHPRKLAFEQRQDPINLYSSSFEAQFPRDLLSSLGDAEWDTCDEYAENNPLGGHKIGGYPHFTQDDPRYDELAEFDVLLFQMDTDAQNGIQWGDMGVANFFVRPGDLARLDFSQVLFNWDCH